MSLPGTAHSGPRYHPDEALHDPCAQPGLDGFRARVIDACITHILDGHPPSCGMHAEVRAEAARRGAQARGEVERAEQVLVRNMHLVTEAGPDGSLVTREVLGPSAVFEKVTPDEARARARVSPERSLDR